MNERLLARREEIRQELEKLNSTYNGKTSHRASTLRHTIWEFDTIVSGKEANYQDYYSKKILPLEEDEVPSDYLGGWYV